MNRMHGLNAAETEVSLRFMCSLVHGAGCVAYEKKGGQSVKKAHPHLHLASPELQRHAFRVGLGVGPPEPMRGPTHAKVPLCNDTVCGARQEHLIVRRVQSDVR